jgi:hypothetical protein
MASVIGANACSIYYDCKCNDSKTGLQVDSVTSVACATYRGLYPSTGAFYNDFPHHQVSIRPF